MVNVPHQLIADHEAAITAKVDAFASQISDAVDKVISDTASHIVRTIQVSNGVVEDTLGNLIELRLSHDVFRRALSRSEFYNSVVIFCSELKREIDEFEALMEPAIRELNLPRFEVTQQAGTILSTQAGAVVSVMDVVAVTVGQDIRRFESRLFGGVSIDSIVSGISDIIRNLTKVVPIAKDQLMIFFRLSGWLWYRELRPLNYAYVGSAQSSREFCRSLSNRLTTFDEIIALNNGQVPGVQFNGGGHNCMHWFYPVEDA